MSRKGPYLPRKTSTLRRAREGLDAAAYQIGIVLAFQRVRLDLTQAELAADLGIDQVQVSDLENGVPTKLSSAKVDALFLALGLDDAEGFADFLKWWGSNEARLY